MHTAKSVRDFLLSQRESDEPDKILAILKTHDGKQLTKRLLAKLPGGEDRWRLSQFATMTHLETRDYNRSGDNTGMHFLMAYATTNVMIDTAWIEEHNPAYFKGRRERNASRDAIGFAQAALMADTLNTYEAAKTKLDEAKKDLDALTEYGHAFSADQLEWEHLCGAREEEKKS